MLKLMYITNRPEIAQIVENAGVERIFIDMEYIGKSVRQGGMDTVQCHHTIEDIRAVKKVLTKAQIMTRCNPIHEATSEYCSSKEEIDAAIEAGADILMLPYFKTAKEVQEFVCLVDGRAKTLPLIETPEAVACIDEILEIDGIDEIFVGLNDLSLGYGMKFMFQLLVDGTVERLCEKFKAKGIPYGFGGIAALGKGMLPSERVIAEHYRLGSTCAILSRSFCNTNIVTDLDEVRRIFDVDLKAIRAWEKRCENGSVDFAENRKEVEVAVNKIVKGLE
jgi:2-keto-3-deoxy-L-rhamnonate aldolase RhmA